MRAGLKRVDRYWHTLRHLRPVQFYGRLWFRFSRPRPNLAPAPRVRAVTGVWQMPARREPSLTGPGVFVFLGESGSLSEVGWDGPQREKLWRYNQHYFDDLNSLGASSRGEWQRALLEDWVARNPPGVGNGWEPYPTSLRIVNWVKWALAGNRLPDRCVHSLAVQVRWLSQRLEIHLLGNHLFANAKALLFASLFFEGREADDWMLSALRILAHEVPEQILEDGGHFERSTMYHALALEDMLDLCNVGAAYRSALKGDWAELLPRWRSRIPRMQDWLHAMCHPDGEISFFNDAALGIAPAVVELDAYAARLGYEFVCEPVGAAAAAKDDCPAPPAGSREIQSAPAYSGGADSASLVRWLDSSGYARLQNADAVALLDLAPVGPDYLPGHAHADTLSFELSVFGQRVWVNSGTSCYGSSAERLRQRGTKAHNTVVVNGEDSSEVWGGFRVARRARVSPPEFGTTEGLSARCAHDGYSRLPGRPVHERRWLLTDNALTVEDSVSGKPVEAEARFHFHPDVVLEAGAEPGQGVAVLPDGRHLVWHVRVGESRVEPSTWHPRFGVSVPNSCLVVRLLQGRSAVCLSWH